MVQQSNRYRVFANDVVTWHQGDKPVCSKIIKKRGGGDEQEKKGLLLYSYMQAWCGVAAAAIAAREYF